MSNSKAVFLTYSLTGNTRFVADKIGKGLSNDCQIDVIHVDAISICKSLHLGERHKNPPEKLLSSDLDKIKELDNLRKAIESAEIVGVGSMVWMSKPAPGFVLLWDEDILPSSLFKNVKYFLVYSSYGGFPGDTAVIFANILKEKNENALYLGCIDIRCPENSVAHVPFKPAYDAMSNDEVGKLNSAIKTLTDSIKAHARRTCSGAEAGACAPSFPTVPRLPKNPEKLIYGLPSKRNAHPLLNKEKCVKCGLCVRVCPYNVIAIAREKKSAREKEGEENSGRRKGAKTRGKQKTCNDIGDIEDGFPVWLDTYQTDWIASAMVNGKGREKEKEKEEEALGDTSECWVCGRCYNSCPKEAIGMSNMGVSSSHRTRYRGPVFLPSLPSSSSSPSCSVQGCSTSSSSSPSSCSSPPASRSGPAPVPVPGPDGTVLQPLPGNWIMVPRMFNWSDRQIRNVYWCLALLAVAVGFILLLFRFV